MLSGPWSVLMWYVLIYYVVRVGVREILAAGSSRRLHGLSTLPLSCMFGQILVRLMYIFLHVGNSRIGHAPQTP